MTLAEAGEIFGYWAANPPAYLILQALARMLGWSPPAPDRPASIEDIATAPPPGVAIIRGGDPAMPAPVLDAAVLRARNRAHALATGLSNGGRAA